MMIIICASLLLIKINTTLAFKIPECPTTQKILSCGKLRTAEGFTYTLPPMNHLTDECEHGWYYQNETFIKDSTGGMTPKNLTLSICEDVQWQIDCHKPVFNCIIKFAVLKNSTTMELQANNKGQEDKKDNNNEDHTQNKGLSDLQISIGIGIAIGIVLVVVLPIIIWKCCRCCKRRNGVV